MKLVFAVAAAVAALGGAPGATATRSKPAGFNDPGNDPRAIMRGAGNYEHVLRHHGIKAGRGYERLKPLHAGHKHLPHVHDYFNFTGTTDGGFLDMRHNAIVRNTTINTDDYAELLTAPGVVFACAAVGAAPAFEPLPAGTAPHYDADHKLVRNNIILTLTLPGALSAAGATTAPALEHLRERLAAAAAGEFTSFAFGFELMATQPAFASGADCAEQVPYATPYFAVARVEARSDATIGSLTLTLTPATPMDLFLSMDTTIDFDPNVQRAHSRRLSAGLHLGADVRSDDAARRLWSATLSNSQGVNWNGQTGANAAASTATIDMLPGLGAGVLACKNCYAYYSVAFSVSFQFCIAYYYYDLFSMVGSSIARDTTRFDGSSVTYTPQLFPDCAALGMQQAVALSYNFGLSASAEFSGQAGLNIQVTSVGFTGKTVVPQFQLISLGTLAALSFGSLLPLSIVPKLGLDAAANITASLPPFSMGAAASVQVSLGGSISLPSMWTGTDAAPVAHVPTINTFHSLTSTFSSQPFTIDQAAAASGNAWGGAATVSLVPWYTISLFGVIPIKASPVYSVAASLWTQGTLPSTRLLREGSGRQLSGCVAASATANTGLAIGIGATTVNDIVPQVSVIVANLIPSTSSFGRTPVTSAATLYSVPSIGGPFSIATPPCPSASPTPSPTPSPSPSVSPPAGLAAAAGSSSSSSSSESLPLGAIIGGAVGAGVVIALLASGVTYFCVSQSAAKLTAAPKDGGAATTSAANPALVVRAVSAT